MWQLTRTGSNVCIDVIVDSGGFYKLLQEVEISSSMRKLLPRTCDRFEEARFFVLLLASLEPCDANRDAANWCLGAYLAAYIGTDDAAKHDFEKNRERYDVTALAKEFWLKSNDPDPLLRDPLAINRLYRELRNIRVHFGENLVEVKTKMQLADIRMGIKTGLPRWYLRQPSTLNLDRLGRKGRRRHLSEFEIHTLREFVGGTPLIKIVSQTLYMLGWTIKEATRSHSE
jgi:hypothetical protein